MTFTSSSWPAASPPPPPPGSSPPPPGGGSGQPSGRTVLVAAVVGLVVFAGIATAAFAASGGLTGETVEQGPPPVEGEPVDCGAGQRCIPGVTVAGVTDALTAQGYGCGPARFGENEWECELRIGDNRYSVKLESAVEDDSQIVQASGSLFTDPDELSAGGLSFLTWVGSIPFAEYPETIAEISAWISQNQRNTVLGSEIGSYLLSFTGGHQGHMYVSVGAIGNPILPGGSEPEDGPVAPPAPSVPPPPPPPGLESEDAEQ